jgi:hypothetical protein
MAMPIALGTDTWNEAAFNAASQVFSVSSRVSSAVGNQLNILDLTRRLWKMDRLLKELLETFYREAANASQKVSEPPSKEQLDMAINTLLTVCGKIDEMYASAKSKGLTNRTLVGTVLNSIQVRSDELREITETILLSRESGVDEIFARAAGELERGETFDLASIK